jgi:hypothetical protein
VPQADKKVSSVKKKACFFDREQTETEVGGGEAKRGGVELAPGRSPKIFCRNFF